VVDVDDEFRNCASGRLFGLVVQLPSNTTMRKTTKRGKENCKRIANIEGWLASFNRAMWAASR